VTATVDHKVDEAPSGGKVPLVELKNVGKSYGNITALNGISLRVHAGEVTGILGDNGAGKSTLIKIISGLHQQSEGELLVDGEPTKFASPKEALGKGIATVYQNLAVVPLMPVWRNFFLGQEIRKKSFPFSLDANAMRATTLSELHKMGIDLPDVDVAIGSLSGGQRQCVAIARAVFFGARVLILDEPTAALGVKQSGVVLKYITAATIRIMRTWSGITSCCSTAVSRNWTAPTTKSTWNTSPRKWPAATNSKHSHTSSAAPRAHNPKRQAPPTQHAGGAFAIHCRP
jgi:simple sugar transport system ATP-binding protein